MTGQTGSGQTRLTLGGSTRRCPRDWNGVPAERFASGSALQAHHALSATRPSSEKQSVPRSCSSVPPARSSTSVQHRDARIRIQIPLVKKRKSLQMVRPQIRRSSFEERIPRNTATMHPPANLIITCFRRDSNLSNRFASPRFSFRYESSGYESMACSTNEAAVPASETRMNPPPK